jgi:hypothetical protein
MDLHKVFIQKRSERCTAKHLQENEKKLISFRGEAAPVFLDTDLR